MGKFAISHESVGKLTVYRNIDYMDEDDPSSGDMTLPERAVNGAAR